MAHVNKSLSLLLAAPRIGKDRKMPTGNKLAALGGVGCGKLLLRPEYPKEGLGAKFLVSFILDLRRYLSIVLWSVFNLF